MNYFARIHREEGDPGDDETTSKMTMRLEHPGSHFFTTAYFSNRWPNTVKVAASAFTPQFGKTDHMSENLKEQREACNL